MKIIGISVRDVADGEREVKVTAIIAANEVLDGSEIGQITDVLDQMDAAGEPMKEAADAGPTQTRRRRASGGTEAATSQGSAAPSGNADAGSSPTEGRRRRATGGQAEASANPPAETTRRRRGAGSDAPAGNAASGTANTTSASSPSEQPAPRRRATGPAQPQGISDADVARAASEAARIISPALVLQILKDDHGVELANEVPQDQRQQFLDTLTAEVKAAEAEAAAAHR